MAIYNEVSDAANTVVRSFLTKIGEYYFEQSFNTGSKKGELYGKILKMLSLEDYAAIVNKIQRNFK